MRKLKVRHETRYAFSAPVVLGEHQLMLRPREGPDLRIDAASLEIEPAATIRWARDPFDNAVATLSFETTPVLALRILSEATVDKFDEEPLDFILTEYAVDFPFAYPPEHSEILRPYFANASRESREAAANWAAPALGDVSGLQTYEALDRLCRAIKRDFTYQAREEPGVQTAEETLRRGVGSCRDFSNLMMEAVRAYGLAARFVSGYRYEEGLPTDLGATHAWTEIFLPGAGWKGFDPTVGALADSNHIATAVARAPTDAPPIAGVFSGGAATSTLSVQVEVSVI